MLMLCAIAMPMLGGAMLPVWRPSDRHSRQNYVVGLACVTAVLAMLAIFAGTKRDPFVLLQLNSHLSVAFRVDGLSCVFGTMVALLWPLVCLYAIEYMSREGGENRFFAFYLASFGVTLGIAFSANILTMYFFYELLTLVTLPLVMHSMDGKARYAGRVYLVYSMSGAALGFIAMVFLLQYGESMFRFGGTISAGTMDVNLLLTAYVLGFFGFGVKAAVIPGHKWLLRASVAPTPVTALLHAVAVVKAGVFAVIRLTWYGFGPDLLRGTWAQSVVMAAAIVTIVFGSAKALQTQHLKRRLAWSTISNLSYILLGITTLTTAGLVAGLTHMVFHAVLKIILFFGVGAIHYKLHRDFVPDIEGCGALMPTVFAAFTTAAVGLMGVPPLAGFSSKWLLATSCAALNTPLGYLGAAALVVSAILTTLYLMQIVMLAYFPRQNRAISVKIPKLARRDPGKRMTLPLMVLALASVFLGLRADWVIRMILRLVIE
ncbi:MAG: proton-conducting transporter membrane subunit [Lawsonibacter sp.]|nr:proton-conducting transporter membrane subunit [Lawsonibacter sp.]